MILGIDYWGRNKDGRYFVRIETVGTEKDGYTYHTWKMAVEGTYEECLRWARRNGLRLRARDRQRN